jgi:hypothetical protein
MPRIPDAVVAARFADGKTDAEIAEGYPHVDEHYVFRRRMKLRLLRPRGSRKGVPRAKTENVSRHGSHALGAGASMPAVDNPAFAEGRTIFPTTVFEVEGLKNVLIEGKNSRKIGGRITKGPASGFPIFTLTLEERKTCPVCAHWRSCYGNNMHLAKRIRHGAAFEERIAAELTILQSRFPGGFAIRLHVLGDFYSVEYVRLWESFLARFPAMFVFGFTARWRREDPIARELVDLVMREWDTGRFRVRFSDAPVDECSTVSIEHPRQKPADAIICPAQTGRTPSCGQCGLCWHTKRRIAFLTH